MVDTFSLEVGKTIPEVKAVIGQAADYVELTMQHFAATKDRLFGKNYGSYLTTTKTDMQLSPHSFRDSVRMLVGNFRPYAGLTAGQRFHWRIDLLPDEKSESGYRGETKGDHSPDVYVAPLIVPIEPKTNS